MTLTIERHAQTAQEMPVENWGHAWDELKRYLPNLDRERDNVRLTDGSKLVSDFEAVRYRFGISRRATAP